MIELRGVAHDKESGGLNANLAHGLSNAGDPGYSAVADAFPSGSTGLDGIWVDATPVLVEEQLIPSLPLAYSTFNSRPGISADGQPYWVGGFSSTPGGATENRALFLGVGATSVLKGGDSIGGIPETGHENVVMLRLYSLG